MINALHKATSKGLCAVFCVSLILNVCMVYSYDQQSKENAAKLAIAVAEARQAERSATTNRDIQNALLQERIDALMTPTVRNAIKPMPVRVRQ